MNKSELLAQADILQWARGDGVTAPNGYSVDAKIVELRAQAATMPETEPVAWLGKSAISDRDVFAHTDEPRSSACGPWRPLYTVPPDQTARLLRMSEQMMRLDATIAELRAAFTIAADYMLDYIEQKRVTYAGYKPSRHAAWDADEATVRAALAKGGK